MQTAAPQTAKRTNISPELPIRNPPQLAHIPRSPTTATVAENDAMGRCALTRIGGGNSVLDDKG
jgi:hypothetical protein